jgi:hypothetical protein
MKSLIRKAKARSREALLEAIGAAISALSAKTHASSTSTAATVQWFNRFDHSCRRDLLRSG